jgi:hypothetical protein
MQDTPRLFSASRTDGLGERLRALLNARVLAEHFGGRFGFLWGEMTKGTELDHHSVAPVSETFSPDFIAAHHLDRQSLDRMQTMSLGMAMQVQAMAGAFPSDVDAIEVSQGNLSGQGVVLPPGTDLTTLYRRAWDSLPFVPALEEARRLAETVSFPARAAAIHLRAGDIVYGHHRLTDRFHCKVCAYPIVEEVIRNQIRDGFTPVLFGQDFALCRYLRDRHGALLATDLAVGQVFDKTQQAIFDVSLMSRCERIFAEDSGFASLATWIAGTERSLPLFDYRADQKVALIEAAIFADKSSADVSPQQRAFACRNAFVVSGIHFPTEPRFQRLLDHAREMDPENDFYSFVQAVASYASGDTKTAEAMIGVLLSGKRRFQYPLMNKPNGEAGYEVDPYLPILTRQAELGFAKAARFVSRAYDLRGDPEKAAYFASLGKTRGKANPAAAGRPVATQSASSGSQSAKPDRSRTLGAVLARLLERMGVRHPPG